MDLPIAYWPTRAGESYALESDFSALAIGIIDVFTGRPNAEDTVNRNRFQSGMWSRGRLFTIGHLRNDNELTFYTTKLLAVGRRIVASAGWM